MHALTDLKNFNPTKLAVETITDKDAELNEKYQQTSRPAEPLLFTRGDQMSNQPINILAISGSLRKKSSNLTLLRAIIAMAPPHVTVTMYEDMAQLPHFNPDLDLDDALPLVAHWRNQLKDADGVLICTPEYAKGVPGTLKNALDWIVSSGEFVNKPVAVVSASPNPKGGEAAHASLLSTLSMMSAIVVEGGTLTVPLVNKKLGAGGDIIDEETRLRTQHLMHALVGTIDSGSTKL